MIVAEEFIINNPSGLHARPASNFVKTANLFQASIKVIHAGREADAKSILEVLSLGASKGSVISLMAEGEDAELAVHTLKELALDDFSEA